MQFPIIIGLHRSRILDGVLLGVTVLAIGAFWAWQQALALRLVGMLVVAANYVATRRHLKPSFKFIKLDRSGNIFASVGENSEFRAVIALPGASVHSWLSVLRIQDETGTFHTVLATLDTMGRDDFRRLRMFLRWRAKFSDSGGAA